MSRNGSGTYLAPAGNPVVTGTVIQSTTFNSTVTDIGNEITNSLPRDGQAPMTAALKVVDGTSTVPGMSFNSESATGIFRPTANNIAITVAGAELLRGNNAGRLMIGTTSDNGTDKLQVNGSISATTTSLTGNLNFYSSGNRITGDFSNANPASRVLFMSSITNGNGSIGTIPNGSSTTANFASYNSSSDPNNSSVGRFGINGTDARLESAVIGTGTYLPLTMWTAGSEKIRLDTVGNFGVGIVPQFKLHVVTSGTDGAFVAYNSTNTTSIFGLGGTNAGTDGCASIRYERSTGTIYISGGTRDTPVTKLTIAAGNNVFLNTTGNNVVGCQSSSGYAAFQTIASGTNASYMFFNNGTGERARIQVMDSLEVDICTGAGATPRLQIYDNGNIVQPTNSASVVSHQIYNVNAGASAGSSFLAQSNAGTLQLIQYSTASGSQTNVVSNAGAGTFYLGSQSTQSINIITNNASRIVIDSAGTISGTVSGSLPNVTSGSTNSIGAFSNAVSGYQKHPGGLIIQWGYSAAWAAVTFPIAFTTVYTVNSTATGGNHEHGVTGVTTSGFSPTTNGTISGFYWIATGV